MDLPTVTDKLPTYPPKIQGELRLILQTKDTFIVCYRQLEEYRRLVDEQKSLITKDFVQEQLQATEDELEELKMELFEAEGRLEDRIKHNEILAQQLVNYGFDGLESNLTARQLAMIRAPQTRKQMLIQRRTSSDMCAGDGERSKSHLIDNIALALDEIHKEVRNKVKPLLDYYRDLFYLQLHFSIVLGEVCNYCMPIVTENIGLLERVFFWSDRPEFELIRKSSDISDRLKEIYTRTQQIYHILSESVRFLQSKVDLQKSLEARFHERNDEQQKMKDKILRDIHAAKVNMDALEEENDKLVGSLVKINPNFVESQNFAEFAERGMRSGTLPRKPVQSSNIQTADHFKPEIEGNSYIANAQDINNHRVGGADKKESVSNPSKRHHKEKKTDETQKKPTKSSRKREVSRRARSIEHRTSSNRRGSRHGLIDSKGRTLSSGEEHSFSRTTRNPSLGGVDRPLCDTESEHTRPRSELFSPKDTGGGAVRRISLKTRLLDRTRGLLDLRRLRGRDSEDSSSLGGLIKSSHPERGDSVLATFSSLTGHRRSDSSVVLSEGVKQKDGLEGSEGQRRKKQRGRRSKDPGPEIQQISVKDDNLLVLNGGSGECESRQSKSKNRSRQNDLANYLASSGSDNLSSTENSVLPVL
ncbi:unnamed protein product [Hydatigera taeniaeformis]|uniref:DUF5743 domain-containing protein n=1 Tax=Hydatigena taeniaeformis TaxID=6205 RepID=A0A0R3X0Z8_HYDTA|nr:unnamed protein product [Hydatigera taeniaeformis]